MTINTSLIKLFVGRTGESSVPLSKELRLQIIPSIADLPKCHKHQFAAFIEDLAILVVWDDNPTKLVSRGADLEEKLLKMVWEEDHNEKKLPIATIAEDYESTKEANGKEGHVDYDVEKVQETRPTRLIDPVMVACTLALLIVALSTGYRQLAAEVMVDHNYLRLVLVLYTPVNAFLCLVRDHYHPGTGMPCHTNALSSSSCKSSSATCAKYSAPSVNARKTRTSSRRSSQRE